MICTYGTCTPDSIVLSCPVPTLLDLRLTPASVETVGKPNTPVHYSTSTSNERSVVWKMKWHTGCRSRNSWSTRLDGAGQGDRRQLPFQTGSCLRCTSAWGHSGKSVIGMVMSRDLLFADEGRTLVGWRRYGGSHRTERTGAASKETNRLGNPTVSKTREKDRW